MVPLCKFFTLVEWVQAIELIDSMQLMASTLTTTNCLESMISICRNHSANVKNWQSGNMALRGCAAGLVEAGKLFRRVNGHLHLPALRAALQRHVAEKTVGAERHDETVNRSLMIIGPPPKFHGTRDILSNPVRDRENHKARSVSLLPEDRTGLGPSDSVVGLAAER